MGHWIEVRNPRRTQEFQQATDQATRILGKVPTWISEGLVGKAAQLAIDSTVLEIKMALVSKLPLEEVADPDNEETIMGEWYYDSILEGHPDLLAQVASIETQFRGGGVRSD